MISRGKYILLNAYHILIDGLFDSIPVLLAFLALTFASSDATIGLIVSIGTALGTVAGLGTKIFSSSLGFIRSTALTTTLYGAGFICAAFSGSMAWVGACFILSVAGHTVFHNLAFSYLTLHTPRPRLGRIMSDFTAIGDVGRVPLVSLAAFAVTYSFFGYEGWRVICLVYGTIALSLSAWLFTRPIEGSGNIAPDRKKFFPSFSLLKQKAVRLSMLGSILNAFSNDRIFTFMPLLLLAKGIDPKIVGSFTLGFTLGSFAGKMACGRFVDAFGPRKVFITAELLLTALLLLLLCTDDIWTVLILALGLGIVTKGTVPVIQAIITEPVQASGEYDDIFSFNSFARGVTNMLTPLLFGLMATIWNMEVVFALMALVAALAALPVWIMPKVTRPD